MPAMAPPLRLLPPDELEPAVEAADDELLDETEAAMADDDDEDTGGSEVGAAVLDDCDGEDEAVDEDDDTDCWLVDELLVCTDEPVELLADETGATARAVVGTSSGYLERAGLRPEHDDGVERVVHAAVRERHTVGGTVRCGRVREGGHVDRRAVEPAERGGGRVYRALRVANTVLDYTTRVVVQSWRALEGLCVDCIQVRLTAPPTSASLSHSHRWQAAAAGCSRRAGSVRWVWQLQRPH